MDRYRQKYTVITVKHSPLVMVWGCSVDSKVEVASTFSPRMK